MDTATRLADELVDALLDEEPLLTAVRYGIRDRDHQLPDHSPEGQRKLRDRAEDVMARSLTVTESAVDPTDRLTITVVRQQAESLVDRIDQRAADHTITDMFISPAASLLTLLPQIAVTEPEHVSGYLDRLAAIPGFLDTVADRHREGIRAGRTPVARLVARAVTQLDGYLSDPGSDPLVRSAQEAEPVVTGAVRPAFARYRELLVKEIAEHGRHDDEPGLCWIAGGERAYAGAIRTHTTTDRTPGELHQIGLDLVAGVRDEFARIGSRVFGTSDVAEIFTRLRTDPSLHWENADQALDTAKAAIARAEKVAPQWFGRLPEQTCVVEPAPAAEAEHAPPAYYLAPAMDGTRPGTYFANTARATERPRYNAEVYAFHEGVPGHHVQLTLAQQLTGLPRLRRIADITAYAEGWALYTERLADEMGLYSDDIARLGLLTLDSLRTARLVVDTGLHFHGWSRDRAVRYLREHTPMPDVEIESETDRYIAWPGQALAYMVGRLEIQRMRADAERALGARFDIRAFHDVVIGSGALPLAVLSNVVAEWVGGG